MLQFGPPDLTPSRADGQPAPRPPDQKPGILVVDDEPLVRDVLKRWLEARGFRVWAVPDGRQALILYGCLGREIDVVLLDVCMPGLDGPHTLDALRRCAPEVRCCFMSGHTGKYETEELLERGAAMVFVKPFPPEAVVESLWRLADRGAKVPA